MTSNGKDPCQLKQPFPVSRFPPLHQAVGFKQHLEQSWLIKWVTVQEAKLENIYEDSTKNSAPEAHKFLTYGLALHASHKAHSCTHHCSVFEHQYRLSWCGRFFFFLVLPTVSSTSIADPCWILLTLVHRRIRQGTFAHNICCTLSCTSSVYSIHRNFHWYSLHNNASLNISSTVAGRY